MEKEKVLEELKQINYPGFNRDIVSFGMVKDITVDNDGAIHQDEYFSRIA